MPKKIVSRHEISLALSRDSRKYSLYFKPRLYKELAAAGVTHFVIEAVKSSALVVSLRPIFGVIGERVKGAYTLQEKDSFGHVEFPVELAKRVVGVLGRSCRTEAALFSGSILQVRRPTQEEVTRVLNAALAAESGARRSAQVQGKLPLVN